MIEKLEIEGIHMVVDENMRRYARRKIGRLDRYLSKSVKEAAHAEVMLKNNKHKTNRSTCEVTLHLPKEIINVNESTINIYAAIDIVESKLQHRIQKYKELHEAQLRRHLMGKIRKKAAQNI